MQENRGWSNPYKTAFIDFKETALGDVLARAATLSSTGQGLKGWHQIEHIRREEDES